MAWFENEGTRANEGTREAEENDQCRPTLCNAFQAALLWNQAMVD